MRSRYTAYVLELEAYLLATWHAETRPEGVHLAEEPRPKWLGLAIKRTSGDECHAVVEFVARYKVNGRAFRLHETSRFERIDGCWFYRDGDLA
jgi:SEC-C motif domain protein